LRKFIKPPLATARAALRDGPVYLFFPFVHLFVCSQNAYKKANFSKTKQSRTMVFIGDQ